MTHALANKTAHARRRAEVGRAYARARDCAAESRTPHVIPVLIGLSAHHIVAYEIETSRDVALEMLDLPNRLGDPTVDARQLGAGAAQFHLGELDEPSSPRG
jgi:hypothetical protein